MTDVRSALQTALGSAYVLERELAGGGMSHVFVAKEIALGRQVVVKMLAGDRAAGMSAERFAREVRLAAQLHHPQIVPVLSVGAWEGLPYYVMPLVEGESLRARISRDGALPIGVVVSILRDVAKALEFAHAHGVVHRDIKPDNVLLSGSSAAVTDFGIAKAISASRGSEQAAGTDTPLTQLGTSLGTPAYMSPEQAAGDEVDHRADLYAWGVMAYEMLGGAHPFAHRKTAQQLLAAHVSERPAALASKRADCPTRLVELVMRCLEKTPTARPNNAGEVLATLDAITTGESVATPRPKFSSWLRGPRGVVAALILLIVVSGSFFGVRRSRVSWARSEAIPEINRLADAGKFEDGFALARRALAILPSDSLLNQAARRVTRQFAVTSTPAGARVYRQPLDASDSTWESLGTTPMDSVAIPAGPSRVRIEKAGFRPYYMFPGATPDVPLVGTPASAESEMVAVPRGIADFRYSMPGLGYLPPRTVGQFAIGRYEVTNREFKRFVESDGYRRRELWSPDIRRGETPVSWADAMKTFTDRTGRPGPALWEVGDYPKDQADYPVTGVSWYEADAYARFAGKQLPTTYHWVRGASPGVSAAIIPLSNSDGKGLARVGSFRGMSAYGAFDVAGNAREWVSNSSGTERFLLGGAYNDPVYMFYMANHQDPFDRSPENGFRVASYRDDSAAVLEAPLALAQHLRNFDAERPAPDAIFATYRRLFDYDSSPLDARIERVDTTEAWIRQRVSFAAAYGANERIIAHLMLPRTGTPPFQTVVHFPGAGSIGNALNEPVLGNLAFYVKSGRALLWPIYKSTFERRDALAAGNWYPNASSFYREHVVMWGKDLRRAVDYLYTRADVDTTRLAYSGTSWGGYQSGIMLAVESRFKAAVIQCPGLAFERPQPEVDQLNFLPRIKVPVLMISGRYDPVFPLESSALPMFRLFGAPAEHKRHVVVDAAHCPPIDVHAREGLNWLDKYLGPVR